MGNGVLHGVLETMNKLRAPTAEHSKQFVAKLTEDQKKQYRETYAKLSPAVQAEFVKSFNGEMAKIVNHPG